MSVTCDKFIGYSLDISREWDRLKETADDDMIDLWSGRFDENDDSSRLNKEFSFVGFYGNRIYGGLKGKVTLLDDGMSGEFTKLFYVIEYAEDCDGDEDENIVSVINRLIDNKRKIPSSIKAKIAKVYNEIFGTDKIAGSLDIHTEFLSFYH